MSVPGRYVPEQGVKCLGYLVKEVKESQVSVVWKVLGVYVLGEGGGGCALL